MSLELQVNGVSESVASNTPDVLLPDRYGIYRRFTENSPLWRGCRVSFPPEFLIMEFTASGDTPNPLTDFRLRVDSVTGLPSYSFRDDRVLVSDYLNDITYPQPEILVGEKVKIFFNSKEFILHIYLNQCYLNGEFISLRNFSRLTVCYVSDNYFGGSFPDLTNCRRLTILYINRCLLTSYVGGNLLYFTEDLEITAKENALTEDAVNNLLIDLANGVIEKTLTLNLSGGTNAAPTGDGLSAKNKLISDGHTITTN